jgi:phage tail-like protein
VTAPSRYLEYLPPVLWEHDPPAPALSVSAIVRIAEKMLSGLDDGVPIVHELADHSVHVHEPIEVVIERLYRLYNPWATPPGALEWLASWLALDFPKIWDEYQRRLITTRIVQIYQRRGLKSGLDTYLELYTVAAKRPRITVDDSAKVLLLDPMRGRSVTATALVSQQPLIRPLALTVGPDGFLYVADVGTPTAAPITVPEAVWRISRTGQYEFSGGALPAERALGPAAWALTTPMAVVADTAAPFHLYVLDNVGPPGATALWRLTSPGFAVATAVATKLQLGTQIPVAMVLDTNGHLLILDRRSGFGSLLPPCILDVDVSGGAPVVTVHVLTTVVFPLSLLLLANGDLIVGDGRAQLAVGAGAGDLVRVDRTNPAWVESSLLNMLPAGEQPGQNPLVAPTALARGDGTELYVLDAGLRPIFPPLVNPYMRDIARPAAVFRVDLGAAPRTVVRASDAKQFVFPIGMVRHDDTLYVCDPGDPIIPLVTDADWRFTPHRFGVALHFQSVPATTPQERRQYVHSVREILRREGPTHALPTLVSAI